MVEITASYPAGVIGTTLENLQAAAQASMKSGRWTILTLPMWLEQEGFPK